MANLSAHITGVPEGVQSFLNAVEGVSKFWAEVTDYDAHQVEWDRWVKKMALPPEEVAHMFATATLLEPGRSGDTSASAQKSLRIAIAVVARALLTNRLQRDFLFGMTDLLRLRETPAIGYVRLQCETAALIGLMHREPAIAPEWMAASTPAAGRTFFKKRGDQIRDEVKALGFDDFYDEGSNTALHSRIGGVARGYLIGAKTREPGEVRLCYQELDSPAVMVFALLRFLGFHVRLLRLVERLYPELDADRLNSIDRDTYYKFFEQVRLKAIELHKQMGKSGILEAIGGRDAVPAR